MNDIPDGVRDHYRATGLVERLKQALAALGPDEGPLTPQQLSAIDQFHTRGAPATAELAVLARIGRGESVLDVGSGVGGPARLLAASCDCRVTGVDLSEDFVEAARYLSERTGHDAQVSFRYANALDLPFDDASFDVALLQHVAMNIAQREDLYREIRRVLKPGGRFATYDVVASEGEPHHPLPWARLPEASFLLGFQATRDAIEAAGLRVLEWRDDTPAAKAWAKQLQASGMATSPGLGLIMGADFPVLAANLARSLLDDRVGVLMAVFEAA